MDDQPLIPRAEDLSDLRFEKILRDERRVDPLVAMQERADARLVPFTPVTPLERFESFKLIGYRPQGIYWPHNPVARERIRDYLRKIGEIPDVDQRQAAYWALQDRSASWELQGVPGYWDSQQAVARSEARFRIVGWGRRGGKTTHVANEGLGLAVKRPRVRVWFCAPTMDGVSRAFDIVLQKIDDLGIPTVIRRNSDDTKYVQLTNGSVLEGVSLEKTGQTGSDGSAAGAAVDLAIIDEAAQVDPRAWTRVVYPTLTDRNGQAILISSFDGQENFFYQKVEQAKLDMNRGKRAEWELFQAPSYDTNFLMFPQGRRTPILVQAEKESDDPHEFLEQYGAIPRGHRDLIYPEYRDRVHRGDYPFNPDLPVHLAVDPSGGANPYAVAVIQDYGEWITIVDEYYATQVIAEEICAELDRRPWRRNVESVVVDSALPAEIERWTNLGYPAFPVAEKPKVHERLPFHRHMLRDPLRYYALHRSLVNRVLKEQGLPSDFDLDGMPDEEIKRIELIVEEMIADSNISQEDEALLRGCARMFINETCTATVWEHKNYRAQKRRQTGPSNYRDIPKDYANHLMDAIGYYLWQTRRFSSVGDLAAQQTLQPIAVVGRLPKPVDEEELQEQMEQFVEEQRPTFLSTMRQHYSPENAANPYTTLVLG